MDRLGPLLKLLLLLAISRTPISVAATTTSAGLQANFGDVSFAGGMSYDSEHEILYVTGQVGAHSCFVGILKRVAASTTSSNHPTHLEFLSRQVFDERAICQTIAFRKDVSRPGNALLLGLSEEGGLLTDKREEGSRKAKQYGALLSLEYSASGESSVFHPEKSVLMYPAAVTIPRSITNDSTRTNRVFVATMTSDSTDIQFRDALGSPHVSDGGGGGVTTTPNLTPGGGLLKYGKNFAMTVESIRLATEFSSAEPQWRKPFGVKRNSDNVTRNGVTVNQILFRQGSKQEDAPDDETDDALYVVGSTLGSGPAFGEPEFDNDKGYGIIAGFITKLDPDTGGLTSSRRFLFNLNENSENNENPLRDTYIEAVCDATDDEDAIYVVGSYNRFDNDDQFRFLQNEERPVRPERETKVPTKTPTMFPSGVDLGDDEFNDDEFDDDGFDDGEYDDDEFDDDANFDDDNAFDNDGDEESSRGNTIATPFIAKLRASTLETIWQNDFESTTNARALGCGIDPKSKAMYVAGNVENGGELAGRTTSLLGDDVFLLRLDTTDGDVSWWKQLGTASDDRLAYGGSGLVVLEGQQGVILMGDTTSNLYSVSSEDSEIFIVEIDADGNLPETTEFSGIDNSPGASFVKLSNPKKVGGEEQTDSGTSKQTKPEINTNESGSVDTPEAPDSTFTESISLTGHRLYSFISVCLLAFAIFGFWKCRSEKRKREATERALVFSYLQDFDLEDIDVKQAATGGWHGTYVGSLAQGVNVLQNETVSSSDGSWDCGNEYVEQRLSKLSHSSVVRDILFMDYDDSVFSSVHADKSDDGEDQTQEKDGIVRDPIEIIKEGEDDNKVDPWGSEII
jgi:hypothetical protein